MRRLIAAIILLAFCCAAGAQTNIVGGGLYGDAKVAGGGGCTAATNFLARTSGLSGTETTAYTNLICGLVTDGIITGNLSGAAGCGSVLDALYIFATKDTTTANLNICGTNFGLTQTGTVTFSADHGYTGNGSTGYLDTGFTPSTAAGNYTQNSASFGVYTLNARITGQAYANMGSAKASSTAAADFFPWYTDNNTYIEVNANDSGVAASVVNGMWALTRTASNALVGYHNGSSFRSASTASIGLPDLTFIIGATHIPAGTVVAFSADQNSAAFIGGALNATQAANLSTRINSYMAALGINVY